MTTLEEKRKVVQNASSFLFVPGNRPDRFAKALASGADLVILDLDASVAPDQKQVALKHVHDFLGDPARARRVVVRTNALNSPWAIDELKALADVNLTGVILPMVERAEQATSAMSLLRNNAAMICLVESAWGVVNALEIGLNPVTSRLAFGNMDYETDVHLNGGRAGLIYPSSQIVLASRCGGLPGPIAGVTAKFSDRQSLIEDIRFERSLGFEAKLCIHPNQIPVVNEAFSPTVEELKKARRIVDAATDSYAVNLDGEMIDRPVIERARRLLARKG